MNQINKFQRCACWAWAVSALVFCMFITGCQTSDDSAFPIYEAVMKQNVKGGTNSTKSLTLREGDMVKVVFPGAPNLDTVQLIRRDGKITLELAGEVTAAGLTPKELEKEIIRLCGAQLITKEVVVTVEASLFPVFVTGAVVRPGKIMSDRPISALQAIMEAGGFNYAKANLESVRVIREERGQLKNYRLNLKLTLQGKRSDPFDLKPADIVYVPEKFSWF
jgi:polysaccharide export outer membrane protein